VANAVDEPQAVHPAGETLVIPVGSVTGIPTQAIEALASPQLHVDELAARIGLARPGATARVPIHDGPELLFVCVGADGVEASVDDVRRAAMAAARRCADRVSVTTTLCCAGSAGSAEATAAAEGWVLGSYQYRPESALDVVANAAAAARGEADRLATVTHLAADLDAVRLGTVLGEAANLARDLVNTPAAALVPEDFAAVCERIGEACGFDVSVRREEELRAEGFGGLIGVGRGSLHQPVLVEMRYGPEDGTRHIAIAGKGITFDAGGLSLKSTRGMLTMKADMAAAAAVLAAFVALSRLGSPTPVRGYLACAENMPGPDAMRIGDVLRHRDGTTVEVTDADCEGRLVLADAIAFAVEANPAAIVDLGTLSSTTGLGPDIWAGFGTDSGLVEELAAAGRASGEVGWPMPLWKPYAAGLASDVADHRNYDHDATQPYGSMLAALFLEPFSRGLPWAHIDLGLTVMRSQPDETWCAGANGRGARTLARFLLAWDGAGTT
jgi:leucyl aminopeptidase